MGRKPCCSKVGLNRGSWSATEDKILTSYIAIHGEGKWRDLPKKAGLKRCGKSCRLRWLNYLRPDIKRGNITMEEEELIIRLHKLLGNRWSLIAGRLPGRTDNEIKNYWNTSLCRRVQQQHQQHTSDPHAKTLTKSKERKIRVRRTPAAAETSPAIPAERSHAVIRTKAVRTTKLYLPNTQQQQDLSMTTPSIVHNDNAPPSTSVDPSDDDLMMMDFFGDLDVDKLLSEIHGCDFLQEGGSCSDTVYGDHGVNTNDVIGSSGGPDHSELFWMDEAAVVMEDWRDCITSSDNLDEGLEFHLRSEVEHCIQNN